MQRANGLDEFYSQMKKGNGVEYFVDKHGQPTMHRPHVHVTHHGSGRVDVVATDTDGKHVRRTTLNDPSGNDVNRAVSDGRQRI